MPDDDVDDAPDQDDEAAEKTPEQDPDVKEADEQPASRIRLSDILKAAEGKDDRELTGEEAEAVRAAGERLRGMLAKYIDPPSMKPFANLGRISQYSAGNKFFQMPEIVRMTTLAKGWSQSPVTKFLAASAEPSWMKSLKVVDSDLYRKLGLGQSNLNLLGSHLVRNADLGLDSRVGKFASLWAVQQSSVLARLGTLTKSLKVGFYPPNLAAIESLSIEDVEEVVMIDGIALYAVPRTAIAEKLINAQTTAERRAILGSRWRAISADCRTAIEGCTSDGVAVYAPFVLSALEALDANNAPAAQALAASVIDTVITKHFGNNRRKYTPGQKTTTPQAYEDFTMRQWIAFAPLWQAYQQYHANNGDPIPKTFNRHGSVHGVSSRQFSRRNAVQGLMFLTGVLVFLDEQAAKAQAA